MRVVEQPTVTQREAAWDIVRQHLAPTPVVKARQLGPGVSLKLETIQPTGSFKVRGGLAAVAAHPGREVVGASAGNHGLGLAYAGGALGAEVTVVVPRQASAAKVAALRQFNVQLLLHGDGYSEAEAHALALAASGGGCFVSPYNDPDVIAGQGTMARELLEQVPNLGTVVVPVGGGGLAAGLCLGFAGTDIRVVGVESEASPAIAAALAAGGVVPITVGPTLADGLAGNLEVGAITVEIAAAHHLDVVSVTETDLAAAMAFSVTALGLVLEGAGAVGLAAIRTGLVAPAPDGRETVVILSGRNVASTLLEEILRA
jgi:threonine dehydratase